MKKHKTDDTPTNIAELSILCDSEDGTMQPMLIIKDPQAFMLLQDGDKITLPIRKHIR